MRRHGCERVALVNTLYLTGFSASTFVQKYNLLTLRFDAGKMIIFKVLSGFIRNPLRRVALIFWDLLSKFRPEINPCASELTILC